MAELVMAPVRRGCSTDVLTLRHGRLRCGERVGIAFTRLVLLIEVMGVDQLWVRIDAAAMRAMLAPLGIGRIQFDPLIILAVRGAAEAAADAAAPNTYGVRAAGGAGGV
jgi:hypothetical protein